MLLQRVITALILVPLVIVAIWYLPTSGLALIMGFLVLVCAWEWSLFVPLAGAGRVLYTGSVAVLLLLAHPRLWGEAIGAPVLAIGVLWWLAAAIWLRLYPGGFGAGRPVPVVRGLMGLCAALPCYVAVWQLHTLEQGRWLIFLLLALVWATDTGGYFAGKRFGRRKLAPQISPNKTWEGLFGGVALAAVLAGLAGGFIFAQSAWVHFMILGLSVSLISVVGDLTISMFKRQTGIKDTGRLFPGHGGALDRLDSLLSAAPVMLVAYLAMNRMF